MLPDDDRYLYRGVNFQLDSQRKGRLIPGNPGKPFHDFARCGQHWSRCGLIVCGDSPTNEVAKHTSQESGQTSGTSTTKSYETAKFYATRGGKVAGFVYRIDRERLAASGVAEIVVERSPDDEVIMVASDYGEVPFEIVVSKEHVTMPSVVSGGQST